MSDTHDPENREHEGQLRERVPTLPHFGAEAIPGVWVFHAEGDGLATGAYSTLDKAKQAIESRGVAGCLTWYRIDEMLDPAVPPEHYHYEKE